MSILKDYSLLVSYTGKYSNIGTIGQGDLLLISIISVRQLQFIPALSVLSEENNALD